MSDLFRMEERQQMPILPTEPARKEGDGGGPQKPDVKRPDTSDLLRRMKRVDPDAARRYRQRSGE
ncbi:MAG TPA: ubiquitin-like protein UBact [Chthonomonas sp.]|uniref:ubiquitin-like protein UBact n=1 Tax=Chthonomonas sp. TaxID=2282153 RepID=UPI002B4B5684|nr:ubiquitin-like protein UBact [Chthonomonas sp.]HLH80495.1 ubiquitin-like protein UBact [Chthonomonas sp.]